MSDSPTPPNSCQQCGIALPSESTDGLCPRCLMAEAMVPSMLSDLPATVPISKTAASRSGKDTPDIPLPEELTALLPKGDYLVEGFLGQGGMGAVYKGTQVRLKRPVAIKIMRRDQGQDYDFEQRFEREALAMAKLSHPGIVSVIDYGEAGPDYLYIVMELVDGADMMDVIRTGRMTQEMALTLLPQICDALQFAHDNGIVHRDIKPSNIMLTRDGRIKMADFGLAKRFDVESSFRTQTGTGMGTPDYAAPEQFDCAAQVDHRADIYALGVMIYQMITGQLPRGVWKPPSQRAEINPQWDDIVRHAMESDPKDRYQKASEIKTAVSKITPLSMEGGADTLDHPSSKGNPSAKKADADKNVHAPRQSRVPLLIGITIILAAGSFFALKKPAGNPADTVTGISPTPTVPVSVSSTEAIRTFAGHRYQFVPGGVTWEDAKAQAEKMGGHLATVTSREENDWIYATFGSQLSTLRSSSIWIGGAAEASGQPWKWITGEPFAFTDWSEGAPNYSSTTGQPVQGPFGIVFKDHGRLCWFDDPSKRKNANSGFLVEWDEAGAGP